MTQWTSLFFEHFSLAMLLIAIVIIIIHSFFSKLPLPEIVFRWVVLLALGFTGIYTFIMHAFFPESAAANIGWVDSPFQFEVAMADLTIGVLGIIAFKASDGFRLATIIASLCWLWGDAVGHVRQMIIQQNFAPGNAGSWFWIDIIVPLILLIAFIKLKRVTSKIG